MVLTMASAVALTFVLSSRTIPIYRTNVKLVVIPNRSFIKDEYNLIRSIEALGGGALNTFAEILTSSYLHEEICKTLALPPEEILATYTFSTIVLPGTNALELRVSGSDPQTIVLLANEMGKRAKDSIETSYPIYTLQTFDSAKVPDKPISPNPRRDAGFAAALASIIGVILMIFYDQWLQRRHTRTTTQTLIKNQEYPRQKYGSKIRKR